jgi:hypothetical protein
MEQEAMNPLGPELLCIIAKWDKKNKNKKNKKKTL